MYWNAGVGSLNPTGVGLELSRIRTEVGLELSRIRTEVGLELSQIRTESD